MGDGVDFAGVNGQGVRLVVCYVKPPVGHLHDDGVALVRAEYPVGAVGHLVDVGVHFSDRDRLLGHVILQVRHDGLLPA